MHECFATSPPFGPSALTAATHFSTLGDWGVRHAMGQRTDKALLPAGDTVANDPFITRKRPYNRSPPPQDPRLGRGAVSCLCTNNAGSRERHGLARVRPAPLSNGIDHQRLVVVKLERLNRRLHRLNRRNINNTNRSRTWRGRRERGGSNPKTALNFF